MTGRLDLRFLDAPLAHRGLHDRDAGVIENSISAVRAAVDAGFGIEIDIQAASDATPMVFHDDTLDRLTGLTGPIVVQPVEKLEATALTGGSDPIHTLKDILSEVAGQVPLLIEIKDQDGALGPDMGALPKTTAAALADYDGPLAVMSFNPHAIADFAHHAPHIARGIVTDPFNANDWPHVSQHRRSQLRELPDVETLDLDFISHNVRDLSAPPVARVKRAGKPVFCWTVRDAQTEARARKIADNITFEGYHPSGR
jgi:glycerophosphoryl diester phosphodiesterase